MEILNAKWPIWSLVHEQGTDRTLPSPPHSIHAWILEHLAHVHSCALLKYPCVPCFSNKPKVQSTSGTFSVCTHQKTTGMWPLAKYADPQSNALNMPPRCESTWVPLPKEWIMGQTHNMFFPLTDCCLISSVLSTFFFQPFWHNLLFLPKGVCKCFPIGSFFLEDFLI